MPDGTIMQWGLLPISNFSAVGNYYIGKWFNNQKHGKERNFFL